MYKNLTPLLGLLAASLFAGCGSGNDAPQFLPGLANLVAAEDCDDALAQLKAQATREMERRLEENLERLLDDDYWQCWEYAAEDGGGGGPALPSAPSPGGADDYSTTNTQVAGVDEADFIKNDDQYIYVLADGHLTIVDAWPPSEAHTLSSTEVQGEPKKLYVHADRAVVYSSLDALDPNTGGDYYYGYAYGECTYGYDCDFRGDGRGLLMSVYDLSNKRRPELLRETQYSGSYLNSRRIDDHVYTAVTFPEVQFPGVTYFPEALQEYEWSCEAPPFSGPEMRAMFTALNQANRKIIRASTIHDYLPSVRDVRYAGGSSTEESGLLSSCEGFYLSQAEDGRSLLSLVSFDMSEQGPIAATTIVGRPGAVYASHESLYVAVRHNSWDMSNWYWDDFEERPEATTVHKFMLEAGSIGTRYAGSGAVKGRILNQFAMDDQDGYLRIATTTGHLPDPAVHSTLSVLGQTAEGLALVGQVDDIAPTEDIRSVRFDGDVGFVVTFKKTDPLFVFDLSRPDRPSIRGELKIPGFSTYMHLMDDRHLLTIGYDADDQGSFAWFQGIQLQIIDVSDLDHPRLTHREVIGTRGSTSEAATNHLAFNYYPSRDLLALPMTICEGASGGGGYGYSMTFSGLLIYDVTTADGFDSLGGVPHLEPQSDNDYWRACGNWWTDSSSVVQRSVFMEDYVYSVSSSRINIANVSEPGSMIESIDLTAH